MIDCWWVFWWRESAAAIFCMAILCVPLAGAGALLWLFRGRTKTKGVER